MNLQTVRKAVRGSSRDLVAMGFSMLSTTWTYLKFPGMDPSFLVVSCSDGMISVNELHAEDMML